MLLLFLVLVSSGVARGDVLDGIGSLLPPFITDNFEELIKTADATCKVLPLNVLFSRPFIFEGPRVEIVEFTKNGSRSYRLSEAHREVRIKKDARLVLYVPGWWNTPTDESTTTLVNALLKRTPKILVLDTRLSFCRGYIDSASRVNSLAQLLFSFLTSLHRQGYKLENIHLIGFSLGAHVVGNTGKMVQEGLRKNLTRITALDPAKPCIAPNYRLAKGDARFVQVIHTSAGVLGLEDPIGDLDVYVNGVDVKQPECMKRKISLECDHAQSWKHFAASIRNERSLKGQKCSNWEDLLKATCKGDEVAVGYGCSSKTKGMFLYKSGEVIEETKAVEVKVFNPVEVLTSWLGR